MLSIGDLLANIKDQGSITTNGSIFLHFCWLAANGKIPSIAYSISINPLVLGWAQDKHKLNIQANATHLQHSGSSSLSKDEQIIFMLAVIRDSIKENKIDQRGDRALKDSKNPGFKQLNFHVQCMLLMALAETPFLSPAKTPV